MPGLLQSELRLTRPLPSAEVEGYLNLMRTAELLRRQVTELLRSSDLTPAQYNVLRILAGAGARGCSCATMAERMVHFDPDVTRLVDRLAARGLAQRDRDPGDRRLVITRITAEGSALIERLARPIADLHRRQFAALGGERLHMLIVALEDLRRDRESQPQPMEKP